MQISKSTLSKWAFTICVVLFIVAGCAISFKSAKNAAQLDRQPQKRTLVIWGLSTGTDSKDTEGIVNAYEKMYPNVRVQMLSMGAGGMDNQKILTSVVGGVSPDIIYQDRFELSDFAARHAFLPLDNLIKRDKSDPLDPKPSDFYSAPWQEATYQGKVYGIPDGADDRVLYYNKTIFEQNASKLRAAGLDPNQPPKTWSQLLAYSKVLTEFNPDGSLKRAGFIPNGGNTWLYMYSFQNDASFMSPDLRTCTLASKRNQEALEFMKKGYDILGGYNNDQKFESGFQGNAQDPFFIGKIAMKIDGDWIQSNIAQYGPNTNFGTAPAPVPDDRYFHRGRFKNDKDTFITWIGGFAYAIPRGAKNINDAWNFIKFATSLKGHLIADHAQQRWEKSLGRMYIPRQLANRVANEAQLKIFAPKDPRFRQSLATHSEMMKYGRIRPPTVVSNQLWQQQVNAISNALGGKMTIRQALLEAQKEVQVDLNAYFNNFKRPIINLAIPVYISIVVAVLGVIGFIIWFKRLKIGKLERNEAKWAYFFIGPWVIGFLGLTLGPMLASFFLSFTSWDILNPARYVGLLNYQNLFTSDWQTNSQCFYNAAYLGVFGVPLGIVSGLAVALLLNTKVRGLRFYRTMFYMPSVVPAVASTVLWSWLLTPDKDKGLLNAYFHVTLHTWLGLPDPGWLSVEPWAKPSLILMGLWGAGSGMILWLAGLQGVPNSLYEASEIDGATPHQQFWNVTMPMLSPIIFFNLVMGIIGAMQEFTREYVLRDANGPVGPANSFIVPVYHLFDEAFSFFKMGYASALAWLIFAIILILTGIQFALAKRWVYVEVDQ